MPEIVTLLPNLTGSGEVEIVRLPGCLGGFCALAGGTPEKPTSATRARIVRFIYLGKRDGWCEVSSFRSSDA